VLTERTTPSGLHRRVVRGGASTIGFGVVLDVPPHLLPHASLELLALVGHLVVLAGMSFVLVGLVLAAVAVPRSNHRRLS
jgi:hypothetical protein